jgi:hypothetical protein
VPINDLKGLLKQNGNYVIRSDEANNGSRKILISVLWNGVIKSLEICGVADRGVSFDMVNFKPTVLELIK